VLVSEAVTAAAEETHVIDCSHTFLMSHPEAQRLTAAFLR
jgi:hypothetical protein